MVRGLLRVCYAFAIAVLPLHPKAPMAPERTHVTQRHPMRPMRPMRRLRRGVSFSLPVRHFPPIPPQWPLPLFLASVADYFDDKVPVGPERDRYV